MSGPETAKNRLPDLTPLIMWMIWARTPSPHNMHELCGDAASSVNILAPAIAVIDEIVTVAP
jgi:hypothetical protein